MLTSRLFNKLLLKNNLRLFSTQQDVVFKRLSDFEAGIALYGLNRAKDRNAFGFDMVKAMKSVHMELKEDKKLSVLIIHSLVPGVFCAGANLKERLKMSESEAIEFVSELRGLTTDVANLPMPTIAALDGAAMGGGLELALSCDIIIAADNVKLGLVETSRAVIPGAGGTQRLPRLIQPNIAKELIFTSKVLNGQEAKELGIINHLVPQNSKKTAAFEKALSIARVVNENAPIALRCAKQAINEGLQLPIEEGLKVENKYTEKNILTAIKDRKEGLVAFVEKRKPVYRGE